MRCLVFLPLLLLFSCTTTDHLAHYDPRGVVSIIIDQAATIGVDYRDAMRRAYAYDTRALSDLFRVTVVSDGGGATLHAGYLTTLLSRFGDQRFSEVLAATPARVRRRVIDALDFDARGRDWSRDFPVTFRLAPHDHESLLKSLGDQTWTQPSNQAMQGTPKAFGVADLGSR